MALELSLDSIKDMKKAEYIKTFKNKAAWKKAKAAIFLVDYKLEGKKAVIAIPFKKENEMKLEMKRLKKEKLHLIKKSGGGTILFGKNASGEREAKIEINIGGLKPEVLILKGSPLFDKIKVKIQAIQVGEAIDDAVASAGEVDPNENLPEDKFEDVAVDESPDELTEVSGTYKNTSLEEEITALASKITLAFKEKIQPIANSIKTNAATKEHIQQTNETSELINSLKEKFESAGDEIKNKVGASVDRILELVPNLDKIRRKLGKLFETGIQKPNDKTGQLLEVKNLMKTISDSFKESVQNVILPVAENISYTSEHLNQIDTLTLKINELKQKVSQLSEEAKTSVEDNFKKLLGLLSNLETAKQRIAKIIKAKKISHPESADQQNNSGTNPIESALSTADELNDSVSESVTHTLDNIWDGLNKLRDRIASLELNKFE